MNQPLGNPRQADSSVKLEYPPNNLHLKIVFQLLGNVENDESSENAYESSHRGGGRIRLESARFPGLTPDYIHPPNGREGNVTENGMRQNRSEHSTRLA